METTEHVLPAAHVRQTKQVVRAGMGRTCLKVWWSVKSWWSERCFAFQKYRIRRGFRRRCRSKAREMAVVQLCWMQAAVKTKDEEEAFPSCTAAPRRYPTQPNVGELQRTIWSRHQTHGDRRPSALQHERHADHAGLCDHGRGAGGRLWDVVGDFSGRGEAERDDQGDSQVSLGRFFTHVDVNM